MRPLTKDELWKYLLKDCDTNRHEIQYLPEQDINWREKLACILFVSLVAIVMVAMLWGLP